MQIQKEKAVLELYNLGCSSEEIDDLMHIETLRRKAEQKARNRKAIAKIVKDMEL